MKIYAASPIDGLSDEQRGELVTLGRKWLDTCYSGHDVYFPLEEHDEQMKIIRANPEVGNRLIFDVDMARLKRAHVLVAFHPKLSRGSHFELGYAYATHKTIRIVEFPEFPTGDYSLMLEPFEVEEQFPW